ncbi:MAG: type 1 glutamine amidotransferase [Gammaproteobacteria bacterium]
MSKKQILVFQHLPIEHPGIFRDFMQRDAMNLHTVELDNGDTIPPLDRFDALWVMGGPMDVWQEQEYPWLRDEKQAIRTAVNELGMPYLGICLGHQLLAAALGAEVGPGPAEVGVIPVQKTAAGKQNRFLAGLPVSMNTLQWHSAEVKQVPDGCEVLASSAACAIQALARGNQVLTMQYHQEILATTVGDWSAIPEYSQALESSLGEGAVDRLAQDVNIALPELNATAAVIYNNWRSAAFAE